MKKLENMVLREAFAIVQGGWHNTEEEIVYNRAKDVIRREGERAMKAYAQTVPCPHCGRP